jgi:branched-chain amino acid transport system substrate-binding protein
MGKLNNESRRDFLNKLGVTVGGAGLVGAGAVAGPQLLKAAEPAKGTIPDTPFKTGHMTFLSGPGAVLGEPSLKGHTLAAEEINAQGGLLGKRKIQTITADEAAGTDANVKELRRMKLSENIDMFTGVISSGNSPALGPVAEELGVLTILTDGCTDFLFDKAVPKPKYLFRITNIQSADGITAAIGTAQAWPHVRKIAHLHPDYSYGRNAAEHFTLAIERLIPGTHIVSENWPALGTSDFTAHITKILSSEPDLLFSSVWGGDYVAFYKQALRYGHHPGARCRPACDRQGPPRRRPRRRPRQLPLHLPGRRPLAGQQGICRALLQAVERISELPVGRRLHGALYAEERD